MVDPQRDVIHHRKLAKPLGQAAQFNGRQSNLPLAPAYSDRKTGAHPRIKSKGMLLSEYAPHRRRQLIYRWINISTNEGAAKRLRGRLGTHTFA
jgi:hypothetical protein